MIGLTGPYHLKPTAFLGESLIASSHLMIWIKKRYNGMWPLYHFWLLAGDCRESQLLDNMSANVFYFIGISYITCSQASRSGLLSKNSRIIRGKTLGFYTTIILFPSSSNLSLFLTYSMLLYRPHFVLNDLKAIWIHKFLIDKDAKRINLMFCKGRGNKTNFPLRWKREMLPI